MKMVVVIIGNREEKAKMFDFRIIDTQDGNQIIDRRLKTPYKALTPSQMMEYIETDKTLAYMDRMEEKERKVGERRRKKERNPLKKLACLCGIA